MFEVIGQALLNLCSLNAILIVILGILIGIIFGAIPGLTGTLGILLFLPFTRSMDVTNAVIFLSAIFCGGEFGGSVSAILLGTPGTNSAVCTMMEGYPLAKRGHARKALLMALAASTTGGILSALSLLFLAPTLAKYTLEFGAPEYFAISVFGLSIIASVSGKSLAKGLFAGALGVVLSLVGMDTVTGMFRFTFNNINLYNGLTLVALLTGLFALPNIIEKVAELAKMTALKKGNQIKDKEEIILSKKDTLGFREVIRYKWVMLRSALIGIVIGIIPGIGTGVASFISYDMAKKTSKHQEEYGNGSLEGIAAVESSNNGVTAASLIPLLTLGLPGSPSAAVLIGAFTMQGLAVGPMLFKNQGVVMYTIMIGIVLANIVMFIEGKFLSRWMAKITKIPNDIMIPILVVVCSAGAISINNSGFDLMIFIFAGAVGYFLTLLDVPLVPIVIGFVLGGTMDANLRKGLTMTGGDFGQFVTRPITLVILLVTGAVILYGVLKGMINKKKKDRDEG